MCRIDVFYERSEQRLGETPRRGLNPRAFYNSLLELKLYLHVCVCQVASALDSNPTARRTQLQHKFEQVVALMEDNIYECSSEA